MNGEKSVCIVNEHHYIDRFLMWSVFCMSLNIEPGGG